MDSLDYYLNRFLINRTRWKKEIGQLNQMKARLALGQELTKKDTENIEVIKVLCLSIAGEASEKKAVEKMEANMKLPQSGDVNFCRFHGVVHDQAYSHEICVLHGHCQQPVHCLWFQTCPMHAGGKNMLLALRF